MGFYPQKHVMKYPGDRRRLLLAVNNRLELVAGGASRAFLLISLKELCLSLLSAADLCNSADFVCLQWLVGSVVQRDDALYARMKQREIDGYDSMWDPIFAEDAALGLGDQRLKVLNI